MRKLLFANLRRLWINNAFWLTVILMAVVQALFCLLFSSQASLPMDTTLFISLQGIGVLTSVFFSLFLGTEYNDGTIRNKLIVGHKRSSIYLSSLVTGVIAVTIIYLLSLLTGGLLGVLLLAPPSHSIGQIAVAGIIGWLACVSYIAIFNLIGMLSSSKARTCILCILTAFTLVFAGLTVYALMQGMQSATLQFLFEFSPFGQTVQAMPIDIAAPWKLATYAVALSSAVTGLGLVAFRRKDLK